jgi:hypothetical protein
MEMTLENKNWFLYNEKVILFQKGPFSQWWGGFKGQNGGFSFLGHPFNCCEQFMMCSKASLFGDADCLAKIFETESPKDQRELGRQIAGFNEEKWNEQKRFVVFVGNLFKFRKHQILRNLLLATNDKIIAEAAPWDLVWGTGTEFSEESLDISTWKGQNLLGRALMAVRSTLKYTHGL